MQDDRLRLIFTCCHPALAPEARVALTLRLLGGLTTAEIARAFLVPEPTMAQRLVRAKRKIKARPDPLPRAREHDLPDRLRAVLAVVYLIFNEGYAATAGDALIRRDLCARGDPARPAARRADAGRARGARPARAAAAARSRRAARGRRRRRARAARGPGPRALGPGADRGGPRARARVPAPDQPGPYQLQAAINAVHTDAATARRLAADPRAVRPVARARPHPVVALNRAIALAEVQSPRAALEAHRRALPLDRYHAFHAARADLLKRAGRADEAGRRPTRVPPRSPPPTPSESSSRPAAAASEASAHREHAGGRALVARTTGISSPHTPASSAMPALIRNASSKPRLAGSRRR